MRSTTACHRAPPFDTIMSLHVERRYAACSMAHGKWSIEDAPSKADLAVVVDGVIEFGRAEAADGNAQALACFCREHGEIIAGATGRTEYERLFVDYVWVAGSRRGGGIGTEALRRLERAAHERGARDALLETLSDRTARLYSRLGYETVATIERFVGPFNKYIMRKTLMGA